MVFLLSAKHFFKGWYKTAAGLRKDHVTCMSKLGQQSLFSAVSPQLILVAFIVSVSERKSLMKQTGSEQLLQTLIWVIYRRSVSPRPSLQRSQTALSLTNPGSFRHPSKSPSQPKSRASAPTAQRAPSPHRAPRPPSGPGSAAVSRQPPAPISRWPQISLQPVSATGDYDSQRASREKSMDTTPCRARCLPG